MPGTAMTSTRALKSVRQQTGTTLVELVVTILVLSIALVGVTFAVRGGITRSADTMVELRAVALAQAYIDEILSKRFDERSASNGVPPCRAVAPPPRVCTAEGSFGPDGPETRATYDDVDDYHNLSEGGEPPNQLRDAQGNPRQGYDNFRVEVTVRYINVGVGQEEENLSIDNELGDELDAKLITVTVFYGGLPDGFQFSAYKSNF